MLSQASEEGEQVVVGSIPPRRSVERCDFVENPLLQLKIGIQIDLRGLDRLVTEPQRNHGLLDARCNRSIAVVCRSTCGLTRLCFSDWQALVATATCLANR